MSLDYDYTVNRPIAGFRPQENPAPDKEIYQRLIVNYTYPIVFTHDVFGSDRSVLKSVLDDVGGKQHRMLIVVDSGVLDSTRDLVDRINRFGRLHQDLVELVAPPFGIRGGEECKKNAFWVNQVRAMIESHHLCRQSFVLAIGGGAVLDAAGYAAATAHRGMRLIRMPTTVLAQNDAGVGVKNGVNAFGKKNFIGTFAPPFAVINDFDFLKTLPERELRAGIAEALKVALIKDRNFFDFLHLNRDRLARFESASMETMIFRCAELHLAHIGSGGDPFEFGSARPLDFGHWSAHRLEEMTNGNLRHGEAVAIGVAIDALYSHRIGRISELELEKILLTLEEIGFHLFNDELSRLDVPSSLAAFREHLGGELTITLLDGIGRKVEAHRIDITLMLECINTLITRQPKGTPTKGTQSWQDRRAR